MRARGKKLIPNVRANKRILHHFFLLILKPYYFCKLAKSSPNKICTEASRGEPVKKRMLFQLSNARPLEGGREEERAGERAIKTVNKSYLGRELPWVALSLSLSLTVWPKETWVRFSKCLPRKLSRERLVRYKGAGLPVLGHNSFSPFFPTYSTLYWGYSIHIRIRFHKMYIPPRFFSKPTQNLFQKLLIRRKCKFSCISFEIYQYT